MSWYSNNRPAKNTTVGGTTLRQKIKKCNNAVDSDNIDQRNMGENHVYPAVVENGILVSIIKYPASFRYSVEGESFGVSVNQDKLITIDGEETDVKTLKKGIKIQFTIKE